ncbi:MAG: sulfotransferase family protein, partial [Cellvibrionales bacterium]|nr:sulfotransferase family protein [Cellvibrionales bacterium]
MLCVLGMHRSGTSCLTGSLQDAGVELGDFHSWNPHNLKGNRENQKIVDINDAVLSANNAAWDQPRHDITWPTELTTAAQKLIASYRDIRIFGFKDPRT